MKTGIVAVALLAAPLVAQASWRSDAARTGDALQKVLVKVQHTSPACQQALLRPLSHALDAVDRFNRYTPKDKASELKEHLEELGRNAREAGCPPRLKHDMFRALHYLGRTADALPEEDRPDWADNDGDQGGWGDRDHDRDRDRQGWSHPAPAARMGPVSFVPNVPANGRRNARLDVSQVDFQSMRGTGYYLAARVRPADGGSWGGWMQSPHWTVPMDPYSRPHPYSFMFPYGELYGLSHGTGRLVAHVGLFNQAGQELASQEVPVILEGHGPMEMHPSRNCGTGDDPGCDRPRGGHWAMDAQTFQGFIASVRAQYGDLARKDTCRAVLRANWLTARQLGTVLDQFNSDLIKLDVAKLAAGHVVDPMHALVYSAKFHNSLIGNDYTRVMTGQR